MEGVRLEHNSSKIPSRDLKELLAFISENKSTVIELWLNRFGEAKLKR